MKRSLPIGSVFVNVVLAVAALRAFRPLDHRPILSPVPEHIPAQTGIPEALATNIAPLIQVVTNRFHWRLVESDDYEKYINNLRAIGCPETTIRDIIVADVKKLYAAKCAEPPRCGFWACVRNREAADRAAEQQRQALASELCATLVHLLGDCPPLPHEGRDDLIELAIMRFMLGPLPDGLPESVMAVMVRGEERTSR